MEKSYTYEIVKCQKGNVSAKNMKEAKKKIEDLVASRKINDDMTAAQEAEENIKTSKRLCMIKIGAYTTYRE